MNPSTRIFVNTIAQYSRAIIGVIISLYTTRIILEQLGVEDYGTYNVVAGLITLMGFVSSSLIITTQRFVSYYFGNCKFNKVRKFFVNSVFVHLCYALLLVLIFISFKNFLIFHFLNIHTSRINAAESVYYIVILITFISVMTAPFKALFVARENIVYIVIVEIADAIIKLFLAISLSWFNYDKLVLYAWMMAIVYLAALLAFLVYAFLKYPEAKPVKFCKDISKLYIAKLMGFAGWTTYGSFSVAMKFQGLNMVYNHFFGTIINAAFGICMQVYNAIIHISTSIVQAMNPQIIKAEGAKDRQRMYWLAEKECKFSTMMISVFAIPVMVNINPILAFWLKDVPQNSDIFCQFILASCICDQCTVGLNVMNQAVGKIRNYTIIMYTPKLLIVPLAFMIFYMANEGNALDLINDRGYLVLVLWIYVSIELLISIARIPFLKINAGLPVRHFVKNVFFPLAPFIIIITLIAILFNNIIVFKNAFILNCCISVIAAVVVAWFVIINDEEKLFVKDLKKKFIKKY